MNQTLYLAKRAVSNMRFNCAIDLWAKPPKMIIYQELDHLIMSYPGSAFLFCLAPPHSTLHLLITRRDAQMLQTSFCLAGPPLDYL
jgi:hypothetical protein